MTEKLKPILALDENTRTHTQMKNLFHLFIANEQYKLRARNIIPHKGLMVEM